MVETKRIVRTLPNPISAFDTMEREEHEQEAPDDPCPHLSGFCFLCKKVIYTFDAKVMTDLTHEAHAECAMRSV